MPKSGAFFDSSGACYKDSNPHCAAQTRFFVDSAQEMCRMRLYSPKNWLSLHFICVQILCQTVPIQIRLTTF